MMDRSILWERWEEVDRILTDALDLPADQRQRYVHQAAGDDTRLKQLLLRLLERMANKRPQE